MKKLWVAIFLCAILGRSGYGQEEGRLAILKAQFEELRADLFGAQEEFDERYAGELEKLRAKAVAAGDLELTLAVTEEAKGFKGRAGEPEYSKDADLARLQKIYFEQTGRITAERAGKLKGLVAGYLKQLEDLKVELTRAEKIDEAVAVQAEIRRVEGMVVVEGKPDTTEAATREVEGKEEDLPKTRSQLRDYLIGTVWRADSDGKNTPGTFRFKEEGKVDMPWHAMNWEATGKRELRMFTEAWNFTFQFGDDMKTFESWYSKEDRRWSGTFVERESPDEKPEGDG